MPNSRFVSTKTNIMKAKPKFLGLLLVASWLLAACTANSSETAVTIPASNEAATAVPTLTHSEPDPTNQLVYEGSRFSLQYPITLTFYENERPSADGVVASLENSIALQGSSFLLTVTTFDVAPGTTLADFIDSHVECLEESGSGGQPAALGSLEARLFPDTLCGLNGITYLYAVQGGTGYRLAIESSDAFAIVQPTVQPILDSFQAVTAPSSTTAIEHNGISLRYDPALLGLANIQDVPATADQGMFDQPTPAHTWIGFVPDGIQRDPRNHWQFTREPQILIFSPNDFGSFTPTDERSRQWVAAFQQMVAERPSTFDGEIPVLPLVNAAQMIRAHVQWLDFGSGTGVRFVTEYSQDNLPLINDRLMYVFFGLTGDGLHGVTAVFSLTNSYLPDADQPLTGETPFSQELVDERIASLTTQVNNLADGDFNPPLSQLDALVQSISITPTADDYPVTNVAPQNAQMVTDSDIFDAPNDENSIGSLSAGEAVVVNGLSEDGRYHRILCADGSTGNCWLPVEAIQITDVGTPVPGISGGLVDGRVVQIQALIENVVFAGPSETAAPLGSLRVGEVAEVFAVDESGGWYNIACPRNIGVNCWVIVDTAVNEPTGFFSSDGWKAVTGEYVSFRVPIEWDVKAVTPGGGSVLEEWNLGIPGVESDQTLAFFAIAFDALQPPDLESETPFEIGGQPGAKWVRSGQGYVSYDYYTAGIAGAGSFGIHVTVPVADADLESMMDMLAASVTFNE